MTKQTKNKNIIFGKNIRILRALSGLNINQLASHLGICRATIYALEAGIRTPSHSTICVFSVFFKIKQKDLFKENLFEKTFNKNTVTNAPKIKEDISYSLKECKQPLSEKELMVITKCENYLEPLINYVEKANTMNMFSNSTIMLELLEIISETKNKITNLKKE